jgi:hypothetical protein
MTEKPKQKGTAEYSCRVCKKHGPTRYVKYSSRQGWKCVECCKESSRKYYQKNPAHNKEYYQTPKGKYAAYKAGAKRRGLTFDLSCEMFSSLLKKSCRYCGISPANGVDRIENNEGYVLDNCAPCCCWCNRAKGVETEDEFVEQCARVTEWRNMA